MNATGAPASLVAHIALLALISFGGVPGVLPDLREFIVTTNGWLTDQEFANALRSCKQSPGRNDPDDEPYRWKIGGLPTALASAWLPSVLPARLRTPPSTIGSGFATPPGRAAFAAA